jgi:hypothetical protein
MLRLMSETRRYGSGVLDIFKVGRKGRFVQRFREIFEVDDATGVKQMHEYVAEGPTDPNKRAQSLPLEYL